jgi:GntR family transcriptional regulator
MCTRVHQGVRERQCLYVPQGVARYAGSVISRDSASPLHEQVAEEIRERVRRGEFAVGSKLPSLRDLRETYGVAEVTVHTAIRELQRDGVLVSSPGRGTFVAAVPTGSADDGDALKRMQHDLSALAQRVERLEQVVGPDSPARD